jgi:hypothetical protein
MRELRLEQKLKAIIRKQPPMHQYQDRFVKFIGLLNLRAS